MHSIIFSLKQRRVDSRPHISAVPYFLDLPTPISHFWGVASELFTQNQSPCWFTASRNTSRSRSHCGCGKWWLLANGWVNSCVGWIVPGGHHGRVTWVDDEWQVFGDADWMCTVLHLATQHRTNNEHHHHCTLETSSTTLHTTSRRVNHFAAIDKKRH